jgi:DNA-directed RNA polymerase subunit RPC12/RpoP
VTAAVQRNEDLVLGRLAVREGLCTQEQIDECLRAQANGRETAPLGDILLYKGYLTEIQLKGLLSRQQKKVMACPACGLRYTVLTLSGGNTARCPKCKGPLNETPAALVRTDAEIATRRLPAIPAPAGPMIDLVCIICEHPFKGSMDSAGRVRCPACQSTFRCGRHV